MTESIKITIETAIRAPIERVWTCWNNPEHIIHWSHASEDWTTPFAENDLRVGGLLRVGYGSPDGLNDFTFEGSYTAVEPNKLIEYTIADGRRVRISFEETAAGIRVVETFDAENENSAELQRAGWGAILENFRKYTESLAS